MFEGTKLKIKALFHCWDSLLICWLKNTVTVYITLVQVRLKTIWNVCFPKVNYLYDEQQCTDGKENWLSAYAKALQRIQILLHRVLINLITLTDVGVHGFLLLWGVAEYRRKDKSSPNDKYWISLHSERFPHCFVSRRCFLIMQITQSKILQR